MLVTSFAVLTSCVAIGIAIYLFDKVNNEKQFDGAAFVEDINKQLKVITARFDGILKKELDEVRSEYKKGFELSIEHHESLGKHINENFSRVFENTKESELEIKSIWRKIEKLHVKKSK